MTCLRRRARRSAVALIVPLTLLLAASGCEREHDIAEARILARGMTHEISTLDPQQSYQTEAGSALHDLYEGLVRLDGQGRIRPAVAEEWSISSDLRRYTFRLRDDARWSDGAPLVADDFVWSFRRLVDPATGSPHAGLLAMVQNAGRITAGEAKPETLGVRALDRRTLEIDLDYAVPFLLSVLAHTATVPMHRESVEAFARRFTHAGNLISNGPYRLQQRLEHQYTELVRNPYFTYREIGNIERVRYVPYDEQNVQFTAFRVAQIALTDVVPAKAADVADERFASQFHRRSSKETFFYAFNLRRGPLAEAPRLRAALSRAILREVIVTHVTGLEQQPAYSFVPPMFDGYEPAKVKFAGHDDPSKSLHHYCAARRAELESSPLRVLFGANDMVQRITVAVTSMWRQCLGIETELNKQEYKVYAQTLHDPLQWDVARISWRADYDDPFSFLEIFMAGSPNNFIGYNDAEYDALLRRSMIEADASRRSALLREAEQRLLDASAIAPVYFGLDRVLVSPEIDLGDRVTLRPLPTAELRWK